MMSHGGTDDQVAAAGCSRRRSARSTSSYQRKNSSSNPPTASHASRCMRKQAPGRLLDLECLAAAGKGRCRVPTRPAKSLRGQHRR